MSILEVENLSITYRTLRGNVRAVDGVSFSLEEGESLGIIGESGCGKTTVGKGILRLLPGNAELTGSLFFKKKELIRISESEMRSIRGKEIAMIPQSAMNALDPVDKVKDFIIDGMRAHREVASKANVETIRELFGSVHLEGSLVDHYPHMLSRGMRQRAVIATIFSLRPSLIIADEPTTALDVIVQDQVLKQLAELIKKTRTSLILISHDIGVVAEHCQRMAVMYAGKIVEMGPTADLLTEAYHPYTMGLQNGFLGVRGKLKEIISIPGVPPNLITPPPGCRFSPRCPFSEERCPHEEPMLEEVSPGHRVACHFHRRAAEMRPRAEKPETWMKDSL